MIRASPPLCSASRTRRAAVLLREADAKDLWLDSVPGPSGRHCREASIQDPAPRRSPTSRIAPTPPPTRRPRSSRELRARSRSSLEHRLGLRARMTGATRCGWPRRRCLRSTRHRVMPVSCPIGFLQARTRALRSTHRARGLGRRVVEGSSTRSRSSSYFDRARDRTVVLGDSAARALVDARARARPRWGSCRWTRRAPVHGRPMRAGAGRSGRRSRRPAGSLRSTNAAATSRGRATLTCPRTSQTARRGPIRQAAAAGSPGSPGRHNPATHWVPVLVRGLTPRVRHAARRGGPLDAVRALCPRFESRVYTKHAEQQAWLNAQVARSWVARPEGQEVVMPDAHRASYAGSTRAGRCCSSSGRGRRASARRACRGGCGRR